MPNQGDEVHNQWRHVAINLHRFANRGPLQVTFRAVANGDEGDIALDDIELVCGSNDMVGHRQLEKKKEEEKIKKKRGRNEEVKK